MSTKVLLASMLLAAFSLSGCASDDAPTPTTTDDPPMNSEDSSPPPAPVEEKVELLNTTLSFPDTTGGMQPTSEFQAEDETQEIQVDVFVRGECPGGYHQGPSLTFSSPEGSSTTIELYPGSSDANPTPVACPFVEPEFESSGSETLSGDPGQWDIEGAGECTCEARVVVTATVLR